VNVAVAPFASVAAVQVMVPFVPTAGVVQSKPAGSVIETNSSSAGRTSSTSTSSAASGPSFVRVMV
jgi:hypothetical protein